ncbi:MAG: hypothetical protein JSS46_01530 [Proteobacteria bacterium]|jgi:hypothetical protein|nr:hypothetical protein [Pseudomonadota bacterium]
MMRCVGCKFYDRSERASSDGGGLHWGSCRRSVPTLRPAQGRDFSVEGVWPRVRDDDWCGAWEAREKREKRVEEVPVPADSLLQVAGRPGDPKTPAAAGEGPRQSLMVPPDIARASSPGPNHFASD